MKFRSGLLAASLLVGMGSVALAAPRGPLYDPAQLPEIKGKVAQYLLTPRGDVDGLLLADGTEVHVQPFLSTQLVFTVKPGDAVTIHGLRAKAVPMVMAASITNDASGATVLGGPHTAFGPMEASGTVKELLHTPRGDVDGALLDNGTIVRLPPPEATRLGAELAVGKPLYASGPGSEGPLGKVLAAQAIGASKDHTQTIAAPRPGWMPGHSPMMDHDGPRGPGMHHGMGPEGGPQGAPMGGPDMPPPPDKN
jgi:hypothetical protein